MLLSGANDTKHRRYIKPQLFMQLRCSFYIRVM